jgi:cholesterol transport system auxiliary component
MKRGNQEVMTKRAEPPTNLSRGNDPLPVRTTMAAKLTLVMLMLALCFAAGCGASRPSKYYQLSVPSDTAHSTDPNPIPVTLLIGRLTSPALYREDQIVYSSGGENMGTYEYHRWAEPPTEMIAEVLLRQFRASGRYHGVYSLRSDIRGDYLLHGHLFDFREITGGPSTARVTLELELRNVKTGTTVWTHFYSHDEPTGGKDVGAVVAALDKNVQQGIAEFRASLEQYFAAHAPAP